jgi:putative serine protease PepD
MKRFLIPFVALLASGLVGGVAAVGVWEAVDDDQPSTTTVSATPTSAPTASASGGGLSIGEIYDQASPGVVEVRVESQSADQTPDIVPGDPDDPNPFSPRPGATGSGFVIDDEGHIVTNQHVVGDADEVTVVFEDGEEGTASVVGTDPSTDIALLKLENPGDHDLEPLPLGSSDALEIGDTVVAIGSPFGLQGTLTAGIVSALDREIGAPNGFTIDGAIQTDAALNSGNSGGPLLDSQGRVVGVNSQIQSENGGNVGIGYAVPIDTAREVIEQLKADGEVEHAYLGVSLSEAESGEDGVVATDAVEGGPAADAGLQDGDVIVEIDGEKVESVQDVRGAVDSKQPGDQMVLEVRRDGDTERIEVELGERPASVQ